ncbi:MAG: hypothetical protein WAN10_06725 [Candidatus Acidiferrales bacterium]
MFGTEPEPDSQGTHRVAQANPFVTLTVFALGLGALLIIALKLVTQQRPASIPSQQVVAHAKK